MSRLKIFLSILIIAALSIVFIQNREPTSLKFLCGYGSSYCLGRSSNLPLALWIGLFTLNGIAISLLGQVLNRYSYSGSSRPKYVADDELYSNERNWKENNAATASSNYTNIQDSTIQDKFRNATSYEARQEPQNVERSGSTYSYKYKEAGDRTKSDRDDSRKTPIDLDVNSTTKEEDEDWI